jgi:hypothetical protein
MRTEQNRAEAVLCSTTGGPIMALKNFNWKILTAIGLLAGLIQVAAGVAMYLAGVYFASWSMFPSLLVLLLCIVFGTRWYRDAVLKGHITYGQALIVGIVISVSTGFVYAIYNVRSISFFYPRFLEDLISVNLAMVPPSQRAPEFIATMRESITANTIALSNLIRLSVIGTILSVFASWFLKRRS